MKYNCFDTKKPDERFWQKYGREYAAAIIEKSKRLS